MTTELVPTERPVLEDEFLGKDDVLTYEMLQEKIREVDAIVLESYRRYFDD